MAYDAAVLQRATEQLEKRRQQSEADLEKRHALVEKNAPEVLKIDARLRQTLPKIARATFSGGDPTGEIEALRDENLALQAERDELLQSVGLPTDALDLKPFCPLCGDKGWHGSQMCQCLQDLCAKEQLAELSKLLDLGSQTFETFRLDYYPDVPDAGGGKSPREHMAMVFNLCRQYAEYFGSFSVDNLYLYGAPGLGKTFLSACIARVVSEKGFSVVYDTATNVFSAFEARKFSRSQEDLQDARDETHRYLFCDLLILDDLGTELVTPFIQEALYTLINSRMTSHRRTVISSNLTPAELSGRYTPQIVSRINGTFQAVAFRGTDIRERIRETS